jgi:tRNA threonylcarbamoyladenosine biosynthesis protein TsaE
MKFFSKSEEETADISREFVKSLKPKERANVISLYGNLGAGKSFFTREVARFLGITENIQSPTFVIMKFYELPKENHGRANDFLRFVHIDAYRLESENELALLGWEDIENDPKNLIFVEWADKVEKLMPKDATKIFLEHKDSGREIEIR